MSLEILFQQKHFLSQPTGQTKSKLTACCKFICLRNAPLYLICFILFEKFLCCFVCICIDWPYLVYVVCTDKQIYKLILTLIVLVTNNVGSQYGQMEVVKQHFKGKFIRRLNERENTINGFLSFHQFFILPTLAQNVLIGHMN